MKITITNQTVFKLIAIVLPVIFCLLSIIHAVSHSFNRDCSSCFIGVVFIVLGIIALIVGLVILLAALRKDEIEFKIEIPLWKDKDELTEEERVLFNEFLQERKLKQ